MALARLQMRLGQVERAREILEELSANAEARGDEGTRSQLLWSLSIADWAAGRWAAALDHATEAASSRSKPTRRMLGEWWDGSRR